MKKQIIKISYAATKVAFISCLTTGFPVSAVVCLLASGVLYANI